MAIFLRNMALAKAIKRETGTQTGDRGIIYHDCACSCFQAAHKLTGNEFIK